MSAEEPHRSDGVGLVRGCSACLCWAAWLAHTHVCACNSHIINACVLKYINKYIYTEINTFILRNISRYIYTEIHRSIHIYCKDGTGICEAGAQSRRHSEVCCLPSEGPQGPSRQLPGDTEPRTPGAGPEEDRRAPRRPWRRAEGGPPYAAVHRAAIRTSLCPRGCRRSAPGA